MSKLLKNETLMLTGLVLVYGVLASLYALYTPPWQSPDEPAHYNYIRQLAEGSFPIMEPSDYSQAYFGEVVSSGFDPAYDLIPFSYEDYQPPLYYLLQTPVFWLGNGRLTPLRLFNVFLGMATLIVAYQVARRLLPAWQALTAVAFIAFVPQHMAISASVNNDGLSELLIALLLWGALAYRADGKRPCLLGLLVGAALLTKVTAYLMAPLVGVAILWNHWGDWRMVWRRGTAVFLPALALGLLWWGRNLAIYGWPDFLGISAHDAVVVGQPQTAEWVAQHGWGYVLHAFWRTTFNSFWGQFGWMAVPMSHPAWLYPVLGLFSALVVGGLVWQAWRTPVRGWEGLAAVLLLGLLSLNVLLYVVYNITYVQHQGRYLFASMVPLGVGAAVGLEPYVKWVARRWPWTADLFPLVLAGSLALLCAYALRTHIIPNLGG